MWQGFDPDWLEGEIVRRQARPRWLRPRGWIMRGLAEALWQELAPRIAAARAAASVNTPFRHDPPMSFSITRAATTRPRLIHGWAMHGGIFAPLVDALAAHWRLHLVDLPGHGRSRDAWTSGR